MQVADFLRLYRLDAELQTLSARLLAAQKPADAQHSADEAARGGELRVHLRGLVGSQDAVVAAAAAHHAHPNLFVLHDKDEAALFMADLRHLLPEGPEALLFPSSYKRPYEFDETENANVLMRAEVLNQLNASRQAGAAALNKAPLIVTYPEALSEKVINRQSLVQNTFTAKVGDKLDVNFLGELLAQYDFEKSDFVYEAGQYAVRGGIVDVFSYANELPYRLELFGDEIESIRTFNPETQLSVEVRPSVSIIPNVQTKLLQERRESFLEFLPRTSCLWVKDMRQTLDVVTELFDKAESNFKRLLEEAGGMQIVSKPADLFEAGKSLKKCLDEFAIVEFGKRFYFKNAQEFQFTAKPQPSFNKDFERLLKNIRENKVRDFTTIIAADSVRQADRLRTIFDELDPNVQFQHLLIALREGYVDEQLGLAVYTDHQLFERYYRAQETRKFSKKKALTLRELKTLQPGDYVTHQDYGIARFAGLTQVEMNGHTQEAIRLVYRDDDVLTVSIHALHKIAKYSGAEGAPPTMSKLG
ncbi:MAG: transcription-repair coupling factor, partial [Hymenobacter sp.]